MTKTLSKTRTLRPIALAGVLLLALPLAAHAGPTPEQKCEGGKNQAAGKYAACIAKAEKGLVVKGDMDKYGGALIKCDVKLQKIWDKLGAVCPGDQTPIQDFLDACVESVAITLAGGSLGPDPVTCDADLTTCQGDLSSTNSDLGTCNGNLTTCGTDLSTTNADLGDCQMDLATCVASLGVPKTGQTTCYNTAGSTIPCAGTGQDGDLQIGVPRGFTDNGDGTITDNTTGLMWEKQSDDTSIHDKDNTYTWDDAFAVKVATLNSGSFAGHTDWRVPNRNELLTLTNIGAANPATFSEFNSGCVSNCTELTCSCTRSFDYWTSSTYEPTPTWASYVIFSGGGTGANPKTNLYAVRAVRGGS